MPVRKDYLDMTSLSGCGKPGCTHSTHSFFFHARCHPGAGVEVKYTYGTGVIQMFCRECKMLVGEVEVARNYPIEAEFYNKVEDAPCKCQNCDWEGTESQLGQELCNVPDLFQRISPGELVPVGECPECGALCHVNTHANITEAGSQPPPEIGGSDR